MPSIFFVILLPGNSTSFNQVWWNGKWVCMTWSIREYEGASEVYRLNITHAQLIIVYVRFGVFKVYSSRLCLDGWENRTTRMIKLTLVSRLVVKTGLTIMLLFSGRQKSWCCHCYDLGTSCTQRHQGLYLAQEGTGSIIVSLLLSCSLM